ncbi:MAG: hypothetical protein AB7O92_33500 [Acidimicrobiia bacterium]
MAFQEGVLGVGGRLDVAPIAVEHVVAGIDQRTGLVDRVGVHLVGRHHASRSACAAVRTGRRSASGELVAQLEPTDYPRTPAANVMTGHGSVRATPPTDLAFVDRPEATDDRDLVAVGVGE